MKTIASECTGGLGDLLSRYFAVRAIALDNGYENTIFYNFDNFVSRCENELGINTNGWKEMFKEQIFFQNIIDLSEYTTIAFPLEYEKITLPSNNILLEGYPFSFDYFRHRIDEIINEIKVPDNYLFEFCDKDLVINTRRKEWPKATIEFIDLCCTDYYINAINKCQPSRVILVSDDIPWTIDWYEKEIYPKVKKSFIFYEADSMKQFEFMVKSPNLAICQSSFSRWAGILNKNTVYSPHQWYRTVDKKTTTMNLDKWTKIKYIFE